MDPQLHHTQQRDDAQNVNDTPAVRSSLVEPTVTGTPVLAEDLYGNKVDPQPQAQAQVRSFAKREEGVKHGSAPTLSTAYNETHLTDPHHHGRQHTSVNREQWKSYNPNSTGLEDLGVYGSDMGRVGHGDKDVDREQGIGNLSGMVETSTTTYVIKDVGERKLQDSGN